MFGIPAQSATACGEDVKLLYQAKARFRFKRIQVAGDAGVFQFSQNFYLSFVSFKTRPVGTRSGKTEFFDNYPLRWIETGISGEVGNAPPFLVASQFSDDLISAHFPESKVSLWTTELMQT
jgi:hypothetical protein